MASTNVSIFRGGDIPPSLKAKLLDQVREVLRLKHCSLCAQVTESAASATCRCEPKTATGSGFDAASFDRSPPRL